MTLGGVPGDIFMVQLRLFWLACQVEPKVWTKWSYCLKQVKLIFRFLCRSKYEVCLKCLFPKRKYPLFSVLHCYFWRHGAFSLIFPRTILHFITVKLAHICYIFTGFFLFYISIVYCTSEKNIQTWFLVHSCLYHSTKIIKWLRYWWFCRLSATSKENNWSKESVVWVSAFYFLH